MPAEITADMPMQTLLDRYPGARRALFSAFHIGGCQSCAYELSDSLEKVCEKNEIDVNEAVTCLLKSQEHDQLMLISPQELDALLKSDEQITLLDTRTREEFESVALPSSQFMTQEIQTALFADRFSQEIDQSLPRYRLEID